MIELNENQRHIATVLKSLTIVISLALLLQYYPPARTDIVEASPEPNPFYTVTEQLEPLPAIEIAKVEQVATKAVKTPPAQPKQATVKVSGNKEDWMRQAGIPENDWRFVDEIITRESNWNFRAVNKSSKATGLCQSLPANKMASAGSDYLTNPVTQLKWCHQYAQGYGSWAKAAEYSRCIGNCFSARANRVVYKDHKWW